MGGYVHAANEGDAHEFHGGRIVTKASGDDALGQLAVMVSRPPRSRAHAPDAARRASWTSQPLPSGSLKDRNEP